MRFYEKNQLRFLLKLTKNKLLVRYAKHNSMKGNTPIFGHDDKYVQTFWKNRNKKDIELKYKEFPERTKFLYDQISNLKISKHEPILEIGCNLGRNLAFLFDNGFNNLTGIEIGVKAVELMKEIHPKMYENSKILEGSVEEKIKQIKDNEISLTFTNEVLQHIHPSSNFVFDEISRITSQFIVLRERESLYSPSTEFPRDYGKIFEDLGWKLTTHRTVTEVLDNYKEKDYTLRIFEKSN